MSSEKWIHSFERTWRLFPTTENIRRLFGFFTHYLKKHVDGSYSDLSEKDLLGRRRFIGEMASKILAWFSLYKKDIVDGLYFFEKENVEERLKNGIINKVNDGKPFDKEDFDAFMRIFEQLTGPYSYMIEVNGTAGIIDGVQNGSHIFRGIHVAGLPGGSVYEVMRELYDLHGGPFAVLQKDGKVYLANKECGNINKLRMLVMKYIKIIEVQTKFEFPIEVKVSGDKLEVIARGSNTKARAKGHKGQKK